MKNLDRIDCGGSSGCSMSGPGVQSWWASWSSWKLVFKPWLDGCDDHADDCPGVGGMNVGCFGIGVCGGVSVSALVSSYW